MTSTEIWADTPFPLIRTPGRGADLTKQHSSVWIASEMCSAHNGLLRALNSIYNQCIYIQKSEDAKDLMKYTEFWCDWIKHHHDAEEDMLFPAFEEITGVKGLMEKNIEQHHAFMPGLEELMGYVKEVGEEFDGLKLRGIIDGFGLVLTKHLTDEIGTLLDLKKFDGQPLKKAYVDFDLELRKGDAATLYPMVFGSSDDAFDNITWPIVPFFVRYLIHYWFERKYQGVWRFSPSTTWGMRRPLAFRADN